MSYTPPPESYIQLGELVLDAAEDLFARLGAADDFCVQFIGPEHAIFGGFNRVVWTPVKGFSPMLGSCTPAFLQRWTDDLFS